MFGGVAGEAAARARRPCTLVRWLSGPAERCADSGIKILALGDDVNGRADYGRFDADKACPT